MMPKNPRIFSVLLALALAWSSLVMANKYDDLSYFFYQPDKLSAPQYPWIQDRPRTVDDFLAPKKSAWRDVWQPNPQVSQYKFYSDFHRSDYERWQKLNLRGYDIVDTEDFEGQFCTYRDSIIGNQWLETYQIEGRCCVCAEGGTWECEYDSVDEDRQCKTPDLELVEVVIEQDETYQNSDADRLFFSGRVYNAGEKESNDFTLRFLVGEEIVSERNFFPLEPKEGLSFSHIDLPGLTRGVILSAGEYELAWEVENEEQEETNIDNNRVTETVFVDSPQIDFAITQVNAFNTEVIDENGRQEVGFEIGIQNNGDYVAAVPDSFIISVFTDPDFPPVHEEIVNTSLYAPQNTIRGFSVWLEPGVYTFGIQVSSEFDETEKNLENNISELPFTVQ